MSQVCEMSETFGFGGHLLYDRLVAHFSWATLQSLGTAA